MVLTEFSIFWISRMEVDIDDFLVTAIDNVTLEALSRPLVDSWKIVIKKLTPASRDHHSRGAKNSPNANMWWRSSRAHATYFKNGHYSRGHPNSVTVTWW